MLVITGLWLGGAGVVALAFENGGAATLLFMVGALLVKIG
jgi:hypothetical protein